MISNQLLSKGHTLIISMFFMWITSSLHGQHYDIVVAQDSSGDYSTLSSAIASLSMYNYERKVIFIKNGIYEEKVRIDQDFVTIIGEDRDSTIIQFYLPRPEWIENKDAIGPGVLNINGDDFILKNITIKNTQPDTKIHAFAIYGDGTRVLIDNCNLLSKGGDTVALWNFKDGMYYHSNCKIEGAVDFVCPRGTCYIRDSEFFTTRETTALWHAGNGNERQKLVVENSVFDAVSSFELARHHYEAQFYLLDCHFSDKLNNTPIYRVTYPDDPSRNRPYNHGDRRYFFNCTKDGNMFDWLSNNLDDAEVSANEIDAAWTFDGLWDPEDTTSLLPISSRWEENILSIYFENTVSCDQKLSIKNTKGQILTYIDGTGSRILRFESNEPIDKSTLSDEMKVISGKVISNRASLTERQLSSKFKLY